MKKAPEGASFFSGGNGRVLQDLSPTLTNAYTSAYSERGVISVQVDHHSLSRRKLT